MTLLVIFFNLLGNQHLKWILISHLSSIINITTEFNCKNKEIKTGLKNFNFTLFWGLATPQVRYENIFSLGNWGSFKNL
jgi:hypothetical protein